MDVEEHARAGTDVVDGLRGFAILVVVAYHLWLFSWYTPPPPADVFARTGYLGVDLFFLISGFCLFFPYARHVVEGTSRPTARTFFYRRFLKIVPSYALALVVTAALAAPTLARPSDAIGPFFTHAFFANNFFNDAFGKTNSVLWSLGIEVQFYLIFPLLAIVFMARPVLTAVAMIAIALVFRHATAGCCLAWETTIRQLPAFLDLFALGMFVAYAYVFARARLPWTRGAKIYFILAAMVLGLIAFAMLRGANGVQYIPSGRETWNVDGRTLLGVVSAAFILTSALGYRWWHVVVGNPLLVFLSLISYNLYLWHTTVALWFQHHHLPPTAVEDAAHADTEWKYWYVGASLGVGLAVSIAVTYFIERPILSRVRPHAFAFDWSRLRAFRSRGANAAPRKTRT